MVVYGENGYGKSSFVDAIECYFYNRIGHLERENVGRAAYRHRAYAGDLSASVRIDFSEPDRSGTLEIDAARHLSFAGDSPDAETFRQQAQQELLILRHRDLSRFVDMTKREKLTDLAPLIGVEILDNTRHELSNALQQLENELATQENPITDRRTTIGVTIGKAEYADADVWDFARRQAASLGITEAVTSLGTLKTALRGVTVASDPQRDERLKVLQHAREQPGELAKLPEVATSAKAFAGAFNRLAADQEALQELALTGLREAGLAVLGSNWWAGNLCPLCQQPIDDREHLAAMLHEQLSSAAELRQRSREVEVLRDDARENIRRSRETLERVLTAVRAIPECKTFADVAAKALNDLSSLDEAFKVPLEPGVGIQNEPIASWEQHVEELKRASSTSTTAVSSAIGTLTLGEDERRRLESYRALSTVAGDLERLEKLTAQHQVIDTQVQSMRKVFEAFERHERMAVSGVLDQISANVSKYYQRLHGGERYSNVKLEFLPHDRGLEFSLEAYGEYTSPPRLVLSESHLNSLGLCLFLAAAREFNSEAAFLVLDDIVNSFDAGHRAQLAELLAEEFQDFQIIAFTHDPIWFDILRRIAPAWELRRIRGWSYELGVQIELSQQDERRRIEQYLNQGETDVAGNLARTYIEGRLKYLCRQVRALVPYREGYENERRMVGELLRDLRRHVTQRRQFGGRNANVWNELEASQFVANVASHDQPDMPTAVCGGDIRYALDKVDELDNLFRCGNCQKWVWHRPRAADESDFQCDCGQLRFR